MKARVLLENIQVSDLFESLSSAQKRLVLHVFSETLHALTSSFLKRGFTWLLPVVTSKATDPLWPDPGASIEARPELELYGERARLTQSMILHKQLLVAAGYEKVFVLSPNVRVERRDRAKTGRHAYEFTQLDFEVKGAKREDIFRLVEGVLAEVVEHLEECCEKHLSELGAELAKLRAPFKVYRMKELEEKYGPDWETLASIESSEPFWVTDIPREFYDYEDLERGEWRNYDLILPEGYGEVLSGAEREWQYDKIAYKMRRDGVSMDSYRYYLELAKRGVLVPSAGAGIGVERLVLWLTKRSHIAEVQPFPRIPGIVMPL
ncbi:asparagine synthetase A [Infirmifilum sp. SLHALR2]|nr:MAG: asparagine synthetase [Thermofilum sp. NZ13]